MLYYGTSKTEAKQFEELLQQRFQLELLGQVHWHLAMHINQLHNFSIELDQSCFCEALVKKYLEPAGTKKDIHHPALLPLFGLHLMHWVLDLPQHDTVRHYMCHKQISQILNSKKPGQIHFEAL
jgi:hypothetical protein